MVAALVTGCEPPPAEELAAPGAPLVERHIRGDTAIVRSAPRPDTGHLMPSWTVEIDADTDAPAEDSTSSSIRSLAVGPDGRLLVALAGTVHRVAHDGASVRRVGSVGQAATIAGIAGLPDGSIVLRTADDRIAIMEADGTVRVERVLGIGVPPDGRDAVLTRDSQIYAGFGPWYGSGDSTDGRTGPRERPAFVRLDDQVLPVDTLFVPSRLQSGCGTIPSRHFRASTFEDIRVRYYPMVRWTLGAEGMVLAGCPARYSFDAIRDDEILRVQLESEPLAVPIRERHAFQGSWVKQMQYRSGAYESWGWRGPSVPETRPLYQRLVAAVDGRVWVWPAQPTSPMATPETWPMAGLPDTIWIEPRTGTFDIFEKDGSLAGHVRLPAEIRYSPFLPGPEPVVRGDTVWAAVADSFAPTAVGRFVISWPDPGASD